MKVTNGVIPPDSQKTEFKKTGCFSNLGKKLKVTLATIKKYISSDSQQKKSNKNLASRDIKIDEKSNKTSQITRKQSNKSNTEANKKVNHNDKLSEITKGFTKGIESSMNKKELKNIMLEVNKEYMFEGLPQDQYNILNEQCKEKLKYFAKK